MLLRMPGYRTLVLVCNLPSSNMSVQPPEMGLNSTRSKHSHATIKLQLDLIRIRAFIHDSMLSLPRQSLRQDRQSLLLTQAEYLHKLASHFFPYS